MDHNTILVNSYFATCTPESAEHGDIATRGENFIDELWSVEDVVQWIVDNGCNLSESRCKRPTRYTWASSDWYDSDIYSCEEREDTLHLSHHAPGRHARRWAYAIREAQRRYNARKGW